MNNKFRRDGTPYPDGQEGLMEWSKDMEDPNKKIVEQTELPNGKCISTVWLGLNHRFEEGKPLIFETMVFPKKGDYGELDTKRYSTEIEAIKGHREMVEKWANKID